MGVVKGNIEEKVEQEEIAKKIEEIIKQLCEDKRKLKTKKKKAELIKKCIRILENISDGWILDVENLNILNNLEDKNSALKENKSKYNKDEEGHTIFEIN